MASEYEKMNNVIPERETFNNYAQEESVDKKKAKAAKLARDTYERIKQEHEDFPAEVWDE